MRQRLWPHLTCALVVASALATAGCPAPTCDPASTTLGGLGLEFAAWDGVLDSTAGDFKFACVGCPAEPTYQMLPFGEVEPEKGPRGSIDFWPAQGVDVTAPISGVISRFEEQTEEQDWEIEILTETGCQVFFDHVREPTVALDDQVSAGDVMGVPGGWNDDAGIGLLEISVMANDVQYCPTMFVEDAAVLAGVEQLMADVEQLTGDTAVYDEDAMPYPGCVVDQNDPA